MFTKLVLSGLLTTSLFGGTLQGEQPKNINVEEFQYKQQINGENYQEFLDKFFADFLENNNIHIPELQKVELITPEKEQPKPEQQEPKQEQKTPAPELKEQPEQQQPAPAPEPAPEPAPAPAPQPQQPEEQKPAPKTETNNDATSQLTAEEQKMVDLVNQARVEAGLQPLKVNLELTNVARVKAKDMIENNYFSHQSPTYGSPFDMMNQFGIEYRTAGENLAGNQSVEAAHKALMNSDGHRANILNPNFTEIGIGIVEGGPYGKMFVQMFKG